MKSKLTTALSGFTVLLIAFGLYSGGKAIRRNYDSSLQRAYDVGYLEGFNATREAVTITNGKPNIALEKVLDKQRGYPTKAEFATHQNPTVPTLK